MSRSMMKYALLFALITLFISSVSWGTSVPSKPSATKNAPVAGTVDGVYQIDAFGNLTAYDGLKKVVNDGLQCTDPECGGYANPNEGNLCVDIYVFHDEEMESCCGCIVTANGSRDFKVNTNLQGNTLTGQKYNELVIEEVSSGPVGAKNDAACDPESPTPTAGLHGWATKVQVVGGLTGITETPSTTSDLGANQLDNLGTLCGAVVELGSGGGVCSCGTFD